jgi:hypothetical protein
MDPLGANQLALRGMERVDEIVVVTLEEVAAVANGDDAVHDHRVELTVVVPSDFTDVVAGLLAQQNQVSAVEIRQHADA